MSRVDAPRRALVGMVVAWVAVVLVVGGLAFVVVSRAGSQVGQASALRTVADAPAGAGSTTPRPAPSSSRPTPTDTASSTPEDEPEVRTRSFTSRGGTVVASCTGSQVRAESITVRDGWRFADEREPDKLEIHFSRTDAPAREEVEGDDDAGEVEIRVGCVDGVPTRYADE
ncbi:hypothetical protein [Phycicoccus avicenniae]|uniref:hypothetical protein n=1 Tax=Phycicoccus avicenniae TaxID=2828860 RepID=UPI003D268696